MALSAATLGLEKTSEGHVITLTGQPELRPQTVAVPRDPSSAAFPVCAALIVEGSDIMVPGVSQNLLAGRTWSLELTKTF